MYPTSVHIPDPWLMGYDLYPMDTLAFKRAFARARRSSANICCSSSTIRRWRRAILREKDGKRFVERVI